MSMRRLWWGVSITAFVLFSFAPAVYELSRAGDLRPERSFELVHNFPTDYNFYLSRIRQGLEGRWTVVERYTAEPHNGSFIHEAYLLMGQTGRWLRVPLWRVADIYHVARFVLGFALLAAIAAFAVRGMRISAQTPAHVPILAFLVAVTSSSFPKLVAVVDKNVVAATAANAEGWRFGGYMAWWSVMDSLQRITFIPHLLIGQAGMLVLVMLATDETVLKRKGNAVLLGLFGFFVGMVFPPAVIFLYAVFAIWMMLHGKRWRVWARGFGTIAFLSAPALVYLSLMTSFYPWKRLAEVDIIRPIVFDFPEYFRAVGPVLPLGILGLFLAWKNRERSLLPAVTWILAWAALLLVFSFVPQQSPLRFSEMIPHVPLGMLTVYLFYSLRRYRELTRAWVMLPLILILTGVFHMYSSYLWQRDFIDHKIRATLPLVPTGSFVMYPLQDFTAAMWYLFDHAPKDAVILSETTAGNYLPVISGLTVYAGHDNTVRYEEKRTEVTEFFAGRMKEGDAYSWIASNRIAYVFYGPQEREDGGIPDLGTAYPFLERAYENPGVTVYRVR